MHLKRTLNARAAFYSRAVAVACLGIFVIVGLSQTAFGLGDVRISVYGESAKTFTDERVRETNSDSHSASYNGMGGANLLQEGLSGGARVPSWAIWLVGGIILVAGSLAVVHIRHQRKRLSARVAAREIPLEIVIDQTPVGIALVEKRTQRFVRVNPRICQDLGYSEAELLKRTVLDVTYPGDPNPDSPGTLAARQGDRPWETLEKRYVRRDGSVMWGRTSIGTAYDEVGGARFAIAVIQDISEERRAADDVRASEERLRVLFESAPDAIFLLSLTGEILDGNVAAERVIGRPRNEIVGKSLLGLNLLGKREQARVAAEMARSALGHPTGPGEYTINRPDGSQTTVEIRSYPVTIKGERQILGIARDITERRRAERELRQSEERYRMLVEKALMGIGISSGNEIVFANPTLLRIHGYDSLEDLRRTPLLETIAPSSRERVAEAMKRAEDDKTLVNDLEYDVVRADGTIRTLRAVSSPFTLGTGPYRLTTFEDITERKRAEEASGRYEFIVNSSQDMMTLIDSDYRYLAVNDSFCTCHGKAREGILGRTVAEMWGKGAFEGSIKQHLDRCLAGQRQAFDGWFETPCTGRRYYETRYTPFASQEGSITLAAVVSRDVTERRLAEAELAKYRENLERLVIERTSALNDALDAANASTFYRDLKTNEETWDERWRSMAGLTDDRVEASYDAWKSLIQPEDREDVEAVTNHAITSGVDAFTNEYRIVRPDGEIRHIESHAKVIRDDAGNATGIVGMNIDVTTRREAEEALTQRDALIRTMIENLPIDFFAVDKDLRYIMQSPTSRAVVGDVIGKRVDEIDVPVAKRTLLLSDYHRAQGGEKLRQENEFVTRAGEMRTFLTDVAPVYVGDEIIATIGMSLDITQRKQAEDRIRQLSRAVEGSPASVMITNLEADIEYVNPKFCETTGFSADEIVGENARILKSGAHPPSFYDELWDTIHAGKEWRGEFCNRKKNGDLFWELGSISPIRGSDGTITHFVAVKEDITEQKHAAWELEQAKSDAERANQAKSDFLANMSHELRTPLNSVIGFSEILQEQAFGDLNEKQQRYVGNILVAGQHLLALINDILDLSKVEAGKMELELSDVRPGTVLRESLVFVREKALKHAITLSTEIDEDLEDRAVQADERKLRQILYNLLSNAVKYTEDGGSVTLSGRVEEGELVVHVRDTGIGIAPEDLHRVFEEFEQLDSSYGKGQQGTGLGLALTKRLVELHGGTISVQSEGAGKGSIFTVALPIRRDPEDGGAE